MSVSLGRTKSTESFSSLSFGNDTAYNSALKASHRIFNHGKMLILNKTLKSLCKCFHFECNLCALCTQCDDADGDNSLRFQSYISDSSYLWRSFRWIWLESINHIAECLELIMIRRHMIWKHRFFFSIVSLFFALFFSTDLFACVLFTRSDQTFGTEKLINFFLLIYWFTDTNNG